MKHFDYIFQAYKDAYKKSRYWFSILYVFLLIQVWVQVAIPGSNLLKTNEDLVWINRFLNYIENTFKPDTTKANTIVISEIIGNRYKYYLKGGFVEPPKKEGIYFISISTLTDSLVNFNLLNPIIANRFYENLFTLVKDSVVSFRKEHIRKDDSLKAALSKIKKI